MSQAQAWDRKIIHVDMDAFFASVEQRDQPHYRGKPVIVGGDPFGRGVVSTCSYEARAFGIRSAMPAAEARRLCPQGVFLKPDFEKYHRESERIREIFKQHTDLVEPVSLDEAYLDVTRHRLGLEDPVMIAELIKQNIFAVTHLTASAGVAGNLFLAKMASDWKKPNGLTVVRPHEVLEFLKPLSVRKIPGIGPVTEKRLAELQITTCGQLADAEVMLLRHHFGEFGFFLHERAHGRDDSEVVPDIPAKQYSVEETFPQDQKNVVLLREKLRQYSQEIVSGLKEQQRTGRTVVLKVKYFDFRQITRSRTLPRIPKDWEDIYRVACELLDGKTEAGKTPVRLLGLGVSGLEDVKKLARERDLFDPD